MRDLGIALGIFALAYAAAPWKWEPRRQLPWSILLTLVLVGLARALGVPWSAMRLTGGAFRPASWSTDAGSLGIEVGGFVAGLLKVLAVATLVAAALLILGAVAVAVRRATRRSGEPSEWSWVPRYGLVELLLATVVVEEVVFRGIILGALTEHHVHLAPILCACVLFGLWHLRPNRRWTAATWKRGATRVAATAVMAFPLALLCLLTGSVIVPAAAHYSGNFTGRLLVARKSTSKQHDRR